MIPDHLMEQLLIKIVECLQVSHVIIELRGEGIFWIIDVGHTTRHTSSEVLSGFSEYHHESSFSAIKESELLTLEKGKRGIIKLYINNNKAINDLII